MYRRLLLGLVALALTGCVSIPAPNTSKGSTTTTTTPASGAAPASGVVTTSCISESATSYQRPFASTAPWNVPVCGLAQDPRSSDWVNRFYYYSHYNQYMNTDPTKATDSDFHGLMTGLVTNPVDDFSVPVYDYANATTTVRVFQRLGWDGGFNIGVGGSIPWNPSWRASTGSDGEMLIIDYKTGREWGLWGLAQSIYGLPINDSQCWSWSLIGYRSGVDLCAGGASISRVAGTTTPTDVNSYGGNNPGSRGVGIDTYAMLVTPQEVATGQINHALAMPVYNTMTGGSGQVCSQAQLNTSAFGSTCGGAVAPAGNFENINNGTHGCGSPAPATALSDSAYRQTTLPEGTRFALHMSDSEIEAWLDSRGFTGQKRVTARAFAVALVNYGFFITDTSCYAASFQVAGASNPDIAAGWRADGITGDGNDLLIGLFSKDRLWTVAPPTNHCTNGTDSKFACPATSITYP